MGGGGGSLLGSRGSRTGEGSWRGSGTSGSAASGMVDKLGVDGGVALALGEGLVGVTAPAATAVSCCCCWCLRACISGSLDPFTMGTWMMLPSGRVTLAENLPSIPEEEEEEV